MKTLKTILAISLFISVVACTKDDVKEEGKPTYAEENFLEGYLKATGFDEERNEKNSNQPIYYERGIDFTPLVMGKITAITIRIPKVDASLRVAFWDVEKKSQIRVEKINVSSPNTLLTIPITDLELLKDKKYAITMTCFSYYQRTRTDGKNALYPIVVGNVKVESFKSEAQPTTRKYPTTSVYSYYTGDLSFNFIQTN